MREIDNGHNDARPPQVCTDKSADILRAMFEHYYKMAMDHHTKATTSSHMLLIVVGALMAFIGLDNKLCGTGDIWAAVLIAVIGVFGILWVVKQHERYFYWEGIANGCQEELTKMVPELKTVVQSQRKEEERDLPIYPIHLAWRTLERSVSMGSSSFHRFSAWMSSVVVSPNRNSSRVDVHDSTTIKCSFCYIRASTTLKVQQNCHRSTPDYLRAARRH